MLRRIERLLLDLSVIAIVGLCLLITVSVVLRAVLNSGVPDTTVMVAELMVAAIVLPLAAATAERAHIVVEFASKMMPARLQDWLVVFGSAIGVLALTPLIWAGWRELASAMSGGSYYFGVLGLPKWPGRAVFVFGMAFCWLRLLLMMAGDIRTIRAGGRVIAPLGASDLMSEHAP